MPLAALDRAGGVGVTLNPGQAWVVGQVHLRGRRGTAPTLEEIAARLDRAIDALADRLLDEEAKVQ